MPFLNRLYSEVVIEYRLFNRRNRDVARRLARILGLGVFALDVSRGVAREVSISGCRVK